GDEPRHLALGGEVRRDAIRAARHRRDAQQLVRQGGVVLVERVDPTQQRDFELACRLLRERDGCGGQRQRDAGGNRRDAEQTAHDVTPCDLEDVLDGFRGRVAAVTISAAPPRIGTDVGSVAGKPAPGTREGWPGEHQGRGTYVRSPFHSLDV